MRVTLEELQDPLPGEGGSAPADPVRPGPVGALAEIACPAERFEEDERAELAETLERELAPFRPRVPVLDAVRSLARPGTSLVAAGGAPGLLLSPLAHLVQALQAVRLARSLAQAWERPVVPVFWVHGDDASGDELRGAWLLNRHLDVQRVSLAGLDPGATPPALRPLEESRHALAACRAAVEQTVGAGARFAPLLDALFPRPGESLADARVRALTELCGGLGLVVVRTDWLRLPLARALARRLADGLGGAPARGGEGRRAVLAARTPQGPRPLHPGGEGWRYPDEPGSRTPIELAAELVQAPEEWLFDRNLFPLLPFDVAPLAAWIGPGGSFNGLSKVVWSAHGFPPWVPAARLTILEPETREALERCGWDAAAVVRAGELPAETGGGASVPPPDDPAKALRDVAARVRRELGELRPRVEELDRRFAPLLRRAARDAGDALEGLAGKLERLESNRRGTGRRHRRRVESTLFPRGLPQAEGLGPLHLLARWGPDWIEPLLDAMPAVPRGPWIARLEPGDA